MQRVFKCNATSRVLYMYLHEPLHFFLNAYGTAMEYTIAFPENYSVDFFIAGVNMYY